MGSVFHSSLPRVIRKNEVFVGSGVPKFGFGAIMRIKVLAFAASLLLISNSSAGIPQSTSTTASSQQAATLLAQSAKLLTGSGAVTDVTLMGTVEWIAGSDDETGTAVYKALSGAHRMDLSFRNGTRSEIVSTVSGVYSGNWVGLDGISHSIAIHNLIADAGWFPAFTLGNLNSSSNTVLTYVGTETRNGASVIHITASQVFSNLTADTSSVMQHLTQVEIYLDSTTSLPVAYVFNSHPDKNALLDIPTEIRYSNYQNVAGAQIPLHVQQYFNNTLTTDLQFQNASLNSGVTVTQITAQ